ncbi:BPI domain containing protein [Giardia muris]|uniref:BPI domain containing protein n=1 Tax=Giardia muris TaxID=5742 RepID=A0A4Z1SV23_GIAMU|nr:BPI domain containing protein [Giardia muris]|eukprot:TNJ29732.1 BPI domain containing protein [Giardia muris]
MLLLCVLCGILARELCAGDHFFPVQDLSMKNLGMSLRFTEHGLEKFCQMGFSIFPSIIQSLPPFNVSDISIATFKLSITNLRIQSFDVSKFLLRFIGDERIRVDMSDGIFMISGDLALKSFGSLHAVFSLSNFTGSAVTKIVENSNCYYRFELYKPFDLATMGYDSFNMDLVSLGGIFGDTLVSLLNGMHSIIDNVLKGTVMPLIANTTLSLIEQMFQGDAGNITSSNRQLVTDIRLLGPILVSSGKAIANWPGYAYKFDTNVWNIDSKARYYENLPSSLPKEVYTNSDVEIVIDREAFNSLYFVLHFHYDSFSLEIDLTSDLLNELLDNPEKASFEDAKLTLTSTKPPVMSAFHAAAGRTTFEYKYSIALQNSTELSGQLSFDLRVGIDTDAEKLEPTVTTLAIYPVANMLTDLSAHDSSGSSVDQEFLRSLLSLVIKNEFSANNTTTINTLMRNTAVNIMNGNFINPDSFQAVFLPNEDKVLILGEVFQNPVINNDPV